MAEFSVDVSTVHGQGVGGILNQRDTAHFDATAMMLLPVEFGNCLGPFESESEGSGGDKERSCDSLLMCFVTMMNHGLRNGGGIGDVLRSPSNKVCNR